MSTASWSLTRRARPIAARAFNEVLRQGPMRLCGWITDGARSGQKNGHHPLHYMLTNEVYAERWCNGMPRRARGGAVRWMRRLPL